MVTAPTYAERVLQLGERPENVHVVGAPGLDGALGLDLLNCAQLSADLGGPIEDPTLLVTYHPVTLEREGPEAAMAALLGALDRFRCALHLHVAQRRSAGKNHSRVDRSLRPSERAACCAFPSLGHLRYLSLTKLAKVVVGNSSSGLIEAPALHTPTVNVGRRQQGRLRGPSVIDCSEHEDEIAASIARALTSEFQTVAADHDSPYGDGHAAPRIARHLVETDLTDILVKRFYAYPAT